MVWVAVNVEQAPPGGGGDPIDHVVSTPLAQVDHTLQQRTHSNTGP